MSIHRNTGLMLFAPFYIYIHDFQHSNPDDGPTIMQEEVWDILLDVTVFYYSNASRFNCNIILYTGLISSSAVDTNCLVALLAFINIETVGLQIPESSRQLYICMSAILCLTSLT